MNKYLQVYKENIPVILLLFYVLGFCYNFFYYQYFNIDIQYYITLTDIIFKSTGNLLLSLLIFLIIEIIVFIPSDFFTAYIFRYRSSSKYVTKSSMIKYRLDRYQSFLISNNRKYYSLAMIIVVILTGIFIFIDAFYFLSLLLLNLIFHLYLVFDSSVLLLDRKIINFATSIMLLVILIGSYCYWGHMDAYNLKDEYTSKIISFENASTSDNTFKFIGETSEYYFILNSKNNDALIYNKSQIHNVKIETNKYWENDVRVKKKELDEFLSKIKYYLNSNKR